MKPSKLQIVFGSFALVAVLMYLSVNWWFSRQAILQVEANLIAMTDSGFSCEDQAQVRIERWGKLGWSRFCEQDGRKEGDWQGWEDQRLTLVGGFRNDRRHGQWKYLSADGSSLRTVEYQDGKELGDTGEEAPEEVEKCLGCD